jgi:hypothetical protein
MPPGERYTFDMIKHFSGRVSLFLLVRTHAQLQYYLNLSDSHRAANQGGVQSAHTSLAGKVAEIHPITGLGWRRKG